MKTRKHAWSESFSAFQHTFCLLLSIVTAQKNNHCVQNKLHRIKTQTFSNLLVLVVFSISKKIVSVVVDVRVLSRHLRVVSVHNNGYIMYMFSGDFRVSQTVSASESWRPMVKRSSHLWLFLGSCLFDISTVDRNLLSLKSCLPAQRVAPSWKRAASVPNEAVLLQR